jgi:hypothetical protein
MKKEEKYKDSKLITKEVMEQYEIIRQSMLANMYDIYAVNRAATILECREIEWITSNDICLPHPSKGVYYTDILSHFSHYMKKYDIKQGGQ